MLSTTPPGSDGSIAVSALARAVPDAAKREESSRVQRATSRSHLDGEASAGDQDERAGIGVPVPAELALDLHDPDIVLIDLGSLLRRPAELTVQNRTLPYGSGAIMGS